jgi:hypothetical protein
VLCTSDAVSLNEGIEPVSSRSSSVFRRRIPAYAAFYHARRCRLSHHDAPAFADAIELEIAAMQQSGGILHPAIDSSLFSIEEMVDRTLEVYERAMGG